MVPTTAKGRHAEVHNFLVQSILQLWCILPPASGLRLDANPRCNHMTSSLKTFVKMKRGSVELCSLGSRKHFATCIYAVHVGFHQPLNSKTFLLLFLCVWARDESVSFHSRDNAACFRLWGLVRECSLQE